MRCRRASSARTDTKRRSWSKGSDPAGGSAPAPPARRRRRGVPQRDVERIAAGGRGRLRPSPRCTPAPAARARLPARRGPSGAHEGMLPSVSVPVLSVNSTSTLPRSSMHTSRLTSTLLRASCRDPAARLVETTAGSSCGLMPTAIASENSSASSTGLCNTTLMTKIAPVSTPATWTSNMENLRSPTWNSVSGCFSLSPTAIRPNSASPPVATTTPAPGPPTRPCPSARSTTVRPAASPPARPGRLLCRHDSPVSTDSSHSSPAVASSRRSAGTTSPSCRSTTSPGTSPVTSTVRGCPSRSTTQR